MDANVHNTLSKLGGEEGTGCNHKKPSVYPFLLLRSSCTLKPCALGGRDSVAAERSAVVTTGRECPGGRTGTRCAAPPPSLWGQWDEVPDHVKMLSSFYNFIKTNRLHSQYKDLITKKKKSCFWFLI